MAISTGGGQDEVLSEINITPLVDVMLVLLVVFIITAPMLTNAVKVNLPKTAATAPLQQKKAVTVSVDAKGLVYIDRQPVAVGSLESELKARHQQGELSLNLQADEGVSYGVVAKIMAIIERAGVDHLSVLTTPGS